MDTAQPSTANAPINAQFVMPWFMGAAWIPKFGGEIRKFLEWRVQVEAMLRAQGLSHQQQADFVLGALEGEAKRELQLVNPRDKDNGQKVLDILTKLYDRPTTKAQLRVNFFNCKQRTDENVNAFILRLRELCSRWQEQAQDETDENDLLLDQLMVGLQAGPIKQELSRQLRRHERLTFQAACKEARALEQELQEGDHAVFSQRVTAPTSSVINVEQLKDQMKAELQLGLLGELRKEIREQMNTLSANLMEEVKVQLSTREMSIAPTNHPLDRHMAMPPALQVKRPLGARVAAYQWDPQGRPICQNCGIAGHIQRRCPRNSSGPQGF